MNFEGKECTFEEILHSRERKSKKVLKLISYFENTVITIKLNIPGPVKECDAYEEFLKQVTVNFEDYLEEEIKNISIFRKEFIKDNGGSYILLMVNQDRMKIKKLSADFENIRPYGRILDIDVYNKEGQISREELGYIDRKCLICNNNSFICRRNKNHSTKELVEKINDIILIFFSQKQ